MQCATEHPGRWSCDVPTTLELMWIMDVIVNVHYVSYPVRPAAMIFNFSETVDVVLRGQQLSFRINRYGERGLLSRHV